MSDVDIAAIVADLQGEVARRRRSGDYPLGMERQMEATFQHIVEATNRHEIDTTRMGGLVARVFDVTASIGGAPGVSSRVPGGAQVHSVAAKLVSRHMVHVTDQVRQLGDAVGEALGEAKRLADAQQSADQRQLVDLLAATRDRLAVLDSLIDVVRGLDERLMALEASSFCS